jgi:hypothetical protein
MFNYATQTAVQSKTLEIAEASSFHEFYSDKLAKQNIIENKGSAPVFIPALFTRMRRNDASIMALTAVVVDVDNDGFTPGLLNFPEHPGDTACALNEAGVEGAVYSSHSNSENLPRFRVVIPSDRPMTFEEFRTVRAYVHRKLLDIEADKCTLKYSQPYFFPTAHAGNADIAFSYYVPGQPLNVDQILDNYVPPIEENAVQARVQDLGNGDRIVQSSTQRLIDRPGHRRERLLRLVFALYRAGKTEKQAAYDLALWDYQNHNQANGVRCGYFFDYVKRPHFKPCGNESPMDKACEMARQFVDREYRTLRSKNEQQQSAGQAGYRPIFGKTFSKTTQTNR